MSDPHPLEHLPTSRRIDAVMAILSSMETQKPGGWTVAELADLCGCSTSAIHERQQCALAKLKHRLPQDITP
ncbi:hypothetical protein ACFPK9_01105 [Rubritalea spongiae]|uniref:RNA polymerase sigma-70 region 4 domain-containing protein n=1 Tax=Rubritalea spongiae TaxID=430797 RepID=A0ABW5E4T9_9BACT